MTKILMIAVKKFAFGITMYFFAISATQAETLYFGGEILTMDGTAPSYVEAVLERKGKIIFAGDRATANKLAESGHTVVNLNGNTMLPGFIDTHVHYAPYAQIMAFHRKPPWEIQNLDSFIEYVRKQAETTPEGQWVKVYGFESALVAPFRPLTRHDLDKATTKHPVLVLYQGFHWASMNTAGLERAQINQDTPRDIPGGGIYFKDDDGQPTGVAAESAVMGFMHAAQSELSKQQIALNMQQIGHEMSANGITSIADLATGASLGVAEIEQLQALAGDPAYPLRITATPLYQLLNALDGPVKWDGNFQAHRIKLLIDASLVGGSSATIARQLNGSTGLLSYDTNEFRSAITAAMDKGFSLAVHTMGDRAHKALLDALERVNDKHPSVGFNHGIEHSALLDPVDLPRVKALNLSVSHLSPFIYGYGDAMRDVVYGKQMSNRLFDGANIINAGINLALHSDAPIFNTKPLSYAWASVNRKTSSGASLDEAKGISVYDALRGITISAAKHIALDKDLGSIHQGKYADLVILDRNPLAIEPSKLLDINVLQTIKGGKTYYERPY